MNGDAAAAATSDHRDAAAQELEDAKMHPALENGSDEEEDVTDDDDDDSDASVSGSDDQDSDDDDDDDEEEEGDDDDGEEDAATASPKPKSKPKPKRKDAEPQSKKTKSKKMKPKEESKDTKRKKQVKGKDVEPNTAAKKKKAKSSASDGGHRKPHRFKPGVSAARLARKLYKDQAEYLGQSEPFVRLVERLLGRSGGINDEKKAVRMTRSSVQGLREIYEKNIEILVAAAGDVCRLTGQTTLSVQHLQAAVALFQRHRHMTSIASFVTLPSLKPANELLDVLQSLGGTFEEVKRKTSRAMDTRSRILARIRHALNGKTDDELRIMAGHLNPHDQGSRRRWFDEALARLAYVGDTTQSSAIDIEAAKVELETNKASTAPKALATIEPVA